MSVDPSHYLAASNDGKPPLLKLINIAARPELNNQFGQAISYSAGRYVVAVLDGATVAAAAATNNNNTFVKLKPENLIEATNVDQLRYGIMMIYTTAKSYITNSDLQNYYGSLILSRLTLLLPASILQHAVVTPKNALFITCGIATTLIITCVIILGNALGYHRLFILTSLVTLFITISSPDWLEEGYYKSNNNNTNNSRPLRICKACFSNFHQRWKDNLINITGYTSITNNAAWAVLFIVLLVAGKSLLLVTPSATTTSMPSILSSSSSSYRGGGGGGIQQQQSIDIEYIYKLGYDDAKAGNDYQTSLLPLKESLETADYDDNDENVVVVGGQYYDNDYNNNDWQSPPINNNNKQRSSFGISTIMSAFTIYKFGKDIVTTPTTGQLILDIHVIMYKLKSVEPWRLGLLAMSLYRLVTTFWQ